MPTKRDKRSTEFCRGERLTIDFEGQPVTAYEGEPLAVALFASGVQVLSRSIKFHRPRGFFCLSGDCVGCLMRVDGQPNIRACRAEVHDGLRCERQNAWPSAGVDILAGADVMFPQGMDHHTLMTSPRVLNELMQKVVRQLGGLGRLPEPEATPAFADLPVGRARDLDLVVVGAGPAGLAAATAAAGAGVEVLVVEGAQRPGGSYLSHPDFGPAAAREAAAAAEAAGAEVQCRAQAIGWFPEDVAPGRGAPGLLGVATPGGLWQITARRYLYATGAHEQSALFTDNDRPGVVAARAAGLLLCSYGVVPGKAPVVLGEGEHAGALAAALRRAGAEAVHIDGVKERVVHARGSSWVTGVEVQDEAGGVRRVRCDLLAVATPPVPASELPRQHGAEVSFATGFGVIADAEGRTTMPGVWATGDVTGFRGVREARELGGQAGRAIARELRTAGT